MLVLKDIQNHIFKLGDDPHEHGFNIMALEVFKYQIVNNTVYKNYVLNLNINPLDIQHYTKIPFLPIEFFKTQHIVSGDVSANTMCFLSSGTTGQVTSKHYVTDIEVYETAFSKGFKLFYGEPSTYCILALLPNYLERTGSSLVYMFNQLIHDTSNPNSGFYLNNLVELKSAISTLKLHKQKTILLGVTYALLDLAEMDVELDENFIVMETGGMKGRREELLKDEIHHRLKKAFKVAAIHSEYGMTELLSQAYSKSNGLFKCPPWMKVLVRDVNDPFSYVKNQKAGGINVIDLANINSCSFIETKDLGKRHENCHFEILGRFDNSDLRGCNLMVQ